MKVGDVVRLTCDSFVKMTVAAVDEEGKSMLVTWIDARGEPQTIHADPRCFVLVKEVPVAA